MPRTQKDGWIKLHRNILNNPISKKSDYAWLWITLLLKASHKNNKILWDGKTIEIKPGQIISGRKKLASETGISESKVYRILKYLENEQQIKQQHTNKFTIITILNWAKYQKTEQRVKQQMNNKRTTSEQQVNTYKNIKNDKNDKNNKKRFLDFVFLTDKEHKKLLDKLGKDKTDDLIERLNNYIGSKGKKYKSHYFTILSWDRKNIEEEPTRKPKYFKAVDEKFTPIPSEVKEKIDKMRRERILDG